MAQPTLPQGYDDIESLQKSLQDTPEADLIQAGQLRALELFHAMAKRVPAYKDFLAKHGVNPADVKTIEDFSNVPTIDKDNYLRAYPRADLCWDGDFKGQSWVISSTSGSTGQPYYFPRTDLQDQFLTITTELYLRSNFDIQNRSTLYIDAFPMGAWIGGVFTYESIKQIAEKGYPVSIITPGIHKQEVINAVKQLGGDFDQIIIGAYAPFLKDILDDGIRAGIDWKKHKTGFIFSAEAFSEKFRDYVLKVTGNSDNLKATLNHYGTVDMGTMAHETPLSILIRRQLLADKNLDAIFPEKKRQPTFAQYDPSLFYFEMQDNNLICSSFSGLPLVRYDLKDYGGILTITEAEQRLKDSGYDLRQLAQEHGIEDTVLNLPFVYIYERNDFTVSYYAFLIYPDTIRRALQHEELSDALTGKFTMSADYDAEGRQRLHVHVETKHQVTHTDELSKRVQRALHEALTEESSEYRETARMIGQDAEPLIYLWDYEDPKHFKAGTKQKWVVK
jgi:phenylacetate-CoA ligase